MSRRLACLVSAIMLFCMIGGVGMHSSATEGVQAVRRQYSTSEEITSICIKENNASVTIRPGEDDQTRVSYVDTSQEKLYDIYVENGTLVVDKLKENPREPIIVTETNPYTGQVTEVSSFSNFSSEDLYRLEVIVPQKQYESITITNTSNGCAELNLISSKNIYIQLEAGTAKLFQTKSNHTSVELEKGKISLDDTESLQYDLKMETGIISGVVLGHDNEYSIEQSMEHGISNLTSRTVSESKQGHEVGSGHWFGQNQFHQC